MIETSNDFDASTGLRPPTAVETIAISPGATQEIAEQFIRGRSRSPHEVANPCD